MTSGAGRHDHRSHQHLSLCRIKLLEIDGERNQKLLPVLQPIAQHLRGEHLHHRFVVLGRPACVRTLLTTFRRCVLARGRLLSRIVRRAPLRGRLLLRRAHDAGLRSPSALWICVRSCEKSTGFAW
jgi:hypothetical protein